MLSTGVLRLYSTASHFNNLSSRSLFRMLRSGLSIFRRVLSTNVTEGEQRLTQILRSGIPGVKDILVEDVSNGCGSMYSIYVEASSFGGKSKVAQHKMVTELLKEQIKDMHGLSIKTKVTK